MESRSCAFELALSEFRFHHYAPDDAQEMSALGELWLSWAVFQQTYKSASFRWDNCQDMEMTDNFDVSFLYRGQGLDTYIPTEIQSSFPLRIFLCTANRVLATALFDPFSTLVKQKGGSSLRMPVRCLERLNFEPVEEDEGFLSASVKISFALSLNDEPVIPPEPSPQSPAKPVPMGLPVRLNEPAPMVPVPDPSGDQQLRHFRVSLELRAISGLKRPGPLVFQFSYPYFGSRQPFRTKQHYYSAEVESRISNGAVSYQLSSSRERLHQLLGSKPLVISAHQRSVMGNMAMGNVVINLNSVLAEEPHSYRCPVTQKTFKNLEDFLLHRQIINDLPSDPNCPHEPVTVYALDGYYPFFDVVEHEDRLRSSTERVSAASTLQQARLRVVVIIEDICAIGPKVALSVSSGYAQQGGGLYNLPSDFDALPEDERKEKEGQVADSPELSGRELERLRQDWERWRTEAEQQWRAALLEKEQQLRAKVQQEAAQQTEAMVDDLRRAQQEVHRMEVKLKASLEEVQRQKMQLTLQEEQMRLRVANKTQALSAIHHNLSQEKRLAIDGEQQKSRALERQLEMAEQALRRMEQRVATAEAETQQMKLQLRQAPETALQQEVVRLQTLLAEMKVQLEREKKVQAEIRLDKEHMRAQVYRLASALKREREKMSYVARQELEQLRLEFLAREERFMLDGDRDMLQTIRGELSVLRGQHSVPASTAVPSPVPTSSVASASYVSGPALHDPGMQSLREQTDRIRQEIERLKGTGMYADESDPLLREIMSRMSLST